MRIHRTFYGAGVIACAFALLCATPAGAQTGGKAGANEKEKTHVLTTENLFEGTGLSAESKNKVLGNLLKYFQSPKSKEDEYYKMKVPATPMANNFDPTSTMAMSIIPTFSAPSDPCASVADEKQLSAMQRLLETTLSSRSMDSAAFAAKVPKGCNGQRLRYYLNVTAQLFPDGGKK